MNMKKVAFEPKAFEELGQWGTEDKKVFKKILSCCAARLYNKKSSNQVIASELCQQKTIYLKNREKSY
jgi:hypothetical protein